MSRLIAPAIADAPEAAKAIFDKVKKAIGMVPNAYVTIGGLSPATLSLLLAGDAALTSGSLSRADLEAIRIAISAQSGCDYCVAAHTMAGKAAGLKLEELRALRTGSATGVAARDALVEFSKHVARSSGTVARERVDAVLAAGYTPTQVVEALMTISLITFTNLLNRVNDTPVDFPTPA